jgi:multiple sugar transport system substrate-binding protein
MLQRRRLSLLATAAAAVLAALGLSACGSSSTNSSSGGSGGLPKANSKQLTLLFGSSGAAETAAVKAAAAGFQKQSGIKVKVVPANNLTQQLAEDFAGGQPPDLFYLDPSTFQQYASEGVLYPYAKSLSNANAFYPALKQAFEYKGTFMCDPKDASDLSLYINQTDWREAGLTSADVPTNWAQLKSVAQKLTTGKRVGLVLDQSHSETDEFLFQNGGSVLNDAKTKVVVDSPQNVKAYQYLQSMLKAGTLKWPTQLNSGWSGEAFGKNAAAMVIVGGWLQGALQSDYPNINYSIHTIPAGPSGTKATLSFTNCWGVPKKAGNVGGAIDFVKYLTTPQQQLKFAKAFGVLPSLKSDASAVENVNSQFTTIINELAYAHPDVAIAGASQALSAWDSSLGQLASSSPADILSTVQKNLQPIVAKNQK